MIAIKILNSTFFTFFTILRLRCVHAHVKTLCARVCVFDWSKKGCGRSNASEAVGIPSLLLGVQCDAKSLETTDKEKT